LQMGFSNWVTGFAYQCILVLLLCNRCTIVIYVSWAPRLSQAHTLCILTFGSCIAIDGLGSSMSCTLPLKTTDMVTHNKPPVKERASK